MNKEGIKNIIYAVFPFVAAGVLQKSKSGYTWKGVLMGILSGLLWFLIIFSGNSTGDLQKQLKESNQTILEMHQLIEGKENQVMMLNDQLDNERMENSIAFQVLNQLEDFDGKSYDKIIDKLYEIDPKIEPLTTVKHDSTTKHLTTWEQQFKFEDNSKLSISREYSENTFIYLHELTKVIQ